LCWLFTAAEQGLLVDSARSARDRGVARCKHAETKVQERAA
jgi:hypothetical protein